MEPDLAAPAIRLIAIGAAMFAFGSLLFAELTKTDAPPPRAAIAISLAASILAALIWAAEVAGPLMSLQRVAHVLSVTLIGKAWLFHVGAAAALAACALRWPRRRRLLSALAALSLSSFAPIGHAAASDGAAQVIRILIQAIHLLGAGFWLGALPLLVRRLAAGAPAAEHAVGVFSRYATVAVFALVAAGLANLFFLTGGRPLAPGSEYARTLFVKLAVVIGAITLAGLNRFWFSPQGMHRRVGALACVEILLLLLAAMLGVKLAMSAPWR